LDYAHERTDRDPQGPVAKREKLSEHVPVDELIDHILLLSKIERGLERSANGEVVTTAEARKRLRKRLK